MLHLLLVVAIANTIGLFASAQDSSVAGTSSDTEVLLSLASHASFPFSWSGSDACEEGWEGVVCGEGVVTGLDFSGSEIGGDVTFLNDLHQLQHLESLLLRGCGLTSAPPLTQLNLRHVDLSENDLSTDISEVLGDLSLSADGLKSLLLRDCALNGQILSGDIQPFNNLVYVDLSHNALTGDIPSHLFELPHSLQFLYLNDNQFTGNLDFDASVVLNIRSLWLHNNDLSDDFPPGTSLGADGNLPVLSELRISSSGLQPNMTMISQHMPFFLEVFSRSSELLNFEAIYGVKREELFPSSPSPSEEESVSDAPSEEESVSDAPSFEWDNLNYWTENCLEMSSFLLGTTTQSFSGSKTFTWTRSFGFVNLEGMGHPELDGHPSTREMASEKCMTVVHKQGMNYGTLLSDGSCTGLWKPPFWSHFTEPYSSRFQFSGVQLPYAAQFSENFNYRPHITYNNGTSQCYFSHYADSIYFRDCFADLLVYPDPTVVMKMYYDDEEMTIPRADGVLNSCDTVVNPIFVIPSDQSRRMQDAGNADVVWLSEPSSLTQSEEFCLPDSDLCQTVVASGSFDAVTCCTEYCERMSESEQPSCCADNSDPCGVDILDPENVSVPPDLETAIEKSNAATATDSEITTTTSPAVTVQTSLVTIACLTMLSLSLC